MLEITAFVDSCGKAVLADMIRQAIKRVRMKPSVEIAHDEDEDILTNGAKTENGLETRKTLCGPDLGKCLGADLARRLKKEQRGMV